MIMEEPSEPTIIKNKKLKDIGVKIEVDDDENRIILTLRHTKINLDLMNDEISIDHESPYSVPKINISQSNSKDSYGKDNLIQVDFGDNIEVNKTDLKNLIRLKGCFQTMHSICNPNPKDGCSECQNHLPY